MNLTPQAMAREAAATGFGAELLEKVIRLMALLDALNSHPFLKTRIALKGGTALNLFHFDVPQADQAVQAVCSREGLAIRRMPLWPCVTRECHPVGSIRAAPVRVLDLHELTAGKLAALLARSASRDLFDAHALLVTPALDPAKLRLGFVVYGGLNRKDWRTVLPGDVTAEAHEVQVELVPLLRADRAPAKREVAAWAGKLVAECRERLALVLPLREHPGLMWKALNVRTHRDLDGVAGSDDLI